MNAQPIGSNIIVAVKNKEALSSGGIYIGTQPKASKLTGTVVATGAGYMHDNGNITPLTIQVR